MLLARAKLAGTAPAAPAVTVYCPATALAVAVTVAWPPWMVADPVERIAEAPAVGKVKRMIPPFTGSAGLTAVTMMARGLAKAAPSWADCGVLPAAGVEREALALERADVEAAGANLAALVRRERDRCEGGMRGGRRPVRAADHGQRGRAVGMGRRRGHGHQLGIDLDEKVGAGGERRQREGGQPREAARATTAVEVVSATPPAPSMAT